MSFFFNDIFGGMPGGHHHFHGGHGHDDSDEEEVDTEAHYKTLGIEKSATQDEIKKAYRKKARQLHPDRHPDEREKYHELFQEVQAAHEVLKDPQKRALYDKYGDKGVKRGGGGARTGSSLFEQMFGGGQRESADSGHKKSPTIKSILEVTLSDIYCGTTKKIKIQRRATNDSSTCSRCKGQGQITQVQRMGPMVLQQRRECPQCGGIGYQLERQEHEIEVHVPVGGKHGESVTIAGEGNQYPDMSPGDVVLQLRQKKHPVFERKGADLGMNYTLSLRQALCGYKIKIDHVCGKTVVITPSDKHEIVQPGSLKVVHTMGLPQRYSPHVKGHLYIVMDVELPKPNTLSMNVIKQFEKLLPDTVIVEDEEDDEEDDAEQDEKQQAEKPQRKQSQEKQAPQQSQKKKQSRGKQAKRNSRKAKQKKNAKKGKSKKGGGGGGGMFSGLQGHFTSGGGDKNKKMEVDEEEEEDDEMIEEVQCHTVDGNPKATPATASNYYQDDDDEDGDGVQCRQM